MNTANLLTYYVHPCGTGAFEDEVDELFFHGTSHDYHIYHLTEEQAELVLKGEWCPLQAEMNKIFGEAA